jgi:hypothetical protein
MTRCDAPFQRRPSLTTKLDMLKRNARAARTALLVGSLSCAVAAGQILPEPRILTAGIDVIGVLDYDGDGVVELIGKSSDGRSILAAHIDADGNVVSEGRIAEDEFETDDLQLADVDGDGRLDLLGIRRSLTFFDRAVVFYDRGNAELEDPVIVGTIGQDSRLVTSDFTLDGILDILVYPATEDIRDEFLPSAGISVLAGTGGGNFDPPVAAQSFGLSLRAVIPASLDQDGDQDFVGTVTLTGSLTIARNIGGTLELQDVPNAPIGYLDLAVGDLNGDSYPDLVGLRRTGPGAPANVDLALGNSAGGFDTPAPVLVDAPGLVADVNIGDFNGDQNLDVAITTLGSVQTIHRVLILRGDGQGGLTVGQPSSNGEGEARRRCVVADVNGDGFDDLTNRSFAQFDSSTPGREVKLTRLGQAPGGLADLGPAIDTTPEAFTSSGFTGDLDGDGVLDLIGQNDFSIVWRAGAADSNAFGLAMPLFVSGEILVVGDLDGDDLDEILVELPSGGGLRIVDSLGGGEFGPLVTPALTFPSDVVEYLVNDFDGDGDLDIVTTSSNLNTLAWVPNLSGFQFGAAMVLDIDPALFPNPPLRLGDFNGDGRTDVLLTRFMVPFSLLFVWAEGLGGGDLGPLQDIGPASSVLAALDIDGDGFDDAVWRSLANGGSIEWSPGGVNGLLPANGSALVAGTGGQVPIGLADIDGDGLRDLITWQPNDEIFGYLRLATSQIAFDATAVLVADRPTVSSGPSTANVPRLVDFGADGDLDVLAGLLQAPVWYENIGRGPVGEAFCGPAVPNSTGAPSRIFSLGSSSAVENSLTLRTADLPANAFGFFIVSQASQPATPVVASSGLLCLDGAIGRYVGPGQVRTSGASGTFALDLDLTAIPQPLGFVAAQPGSTWFFQAWHRDTSPAGPTSNFTDGLQVTFL